MVPVSSLLVQLFVYGHVFMSSQFPAAVSCNLLGSSAGVIPEWACSRKGLVFPECITPFQHLTQQLEGRVAASLILVGSKMILASPFVLCWIRHRNAETDEVLSAMQYVSRLLTSKLESIHDSMNPTQFYSTFEKSYFLDPTLADKSPYMSRVRLGRDFLKVADFADLTQEPSLQPGDSGRIIIAFTCYNTIQSPLRMSRELPQELQSLMKESEYAEFAECITKAASWSRKENHRYYALSVFLWPL
eukprot:748073_1